MADIFIKVTVSVPSRGMFKEIEHQAEIPPDYQEPDYQNFAAHAIERAAERFIAREGWRVPLRHALLANDARASRIEQLASAGATVSSAAILAIFNTPSQEAIDLWGSPPIEE